MLTHSATDTQCQKLYRFQWKDSVTFWNWRLDVMQSNSETFSATPTIELLDHAALTSFPYSWEYDKYPLGLYSAPISTINFNLSLLPDEFIQMLFNPFLEVTENVQTQTHQTTRDIPIVFQAGNLFRLYTDFGRGAGTIYEVFRACQNSGFTNAYSDADKNFPIDIIDFGRAVLESCSVSLLKYTYDDSTHNTDCPSAVATLDLLIDDAQWAGGFENIPKVIAASANVDSEGSGLAYYLAAKEDIDDWINTCINAVALKIMRKTGADIFIINAGNGLPMATYYKQVHEASFTVGGYPYQKGAEITGDGSLKFIAGVVSLLGIISYVDGFVNYGFADILKEEYKEKSFWDFISDWIKNELKRGCVSAASGTSFSSATNDNYYMHIDNLLLNEYVSTSDDENIITPSILPFANVLKKATASYIEKTEGSKDIDSFETDATSTRSGEDLTVSIVANCIPVLPELKMDDDFFHAFPYQLLLGSDEYIGWLLNAPHYLGIYYTENPKSNPGAYSLLNGGLYPIRPWHIPVINLGNKTDGSPLLSSDLVCNAETAGSDYNWTTQQYYDAINNTKYTWSWQTKAKEAIWEPMWEMISFLNKTGGKGAVVANTLLYLYGHPSQWVLTGETYHHANLIEQWFLPRKEVSTDLSKYLPSAVDPAEYNSRSLLTRVSVELTTGMAQFTLLGRRVDL